MRSPRCRGAPIRVPVTTVPKPRMAKTRSTPRRAGPLRGVRGCALWAASIKALRRASRPAPLWEETGTMGAPAKCVEARSSLISSLESSIISSSARSVLVSATTAVSMPSRSQIATCSRVWGITLSSAATTRSRTSIPLAPETMVRTRPSWPGTSTTDSRPTPGRSRAAKPRSMVIPRAFSSGRRSVWVPVRAPISAVLP